MDYYLITYGLTFLAFIISVSAELFVKSTYNKYLRVKNSSNITGAEAARKILDINGLSDVRVEQTRGILTDHYDPSKKVVRLSNYNYSGDTISSVSVAIHECGHALQDKTNYVFMRIRASIIPLVTFASYAGYIAIVLGCILGAFGLIELGIIFEIIILLFQLVTLPVEINASKRALKELETRDILTKKEIPSSRKVLIAAALTYVASVASTILEILRLILIFGRRDDRG